MDDITIFNDSAIILQKKVPKRIISWITILITSFIIFILISFIKFNFYKSYIAIYQNGKVVLNGNVSSLKKDDKLYIEHKQYKYKIINIESNKIFIDINLDDNLKINNNILNVNILKGKTSLFEIIKNKWKEVLFYERN